MEKQVYKLGQLGSVELQKPRSLGIALEFTSLWASELDQSQLARLCSGAICILLNSEKLPIYRPEKHSVLDYGFRCMDRLLALGVYPTQIYSVGSIALLILSQSLPSEEEVSEKVNFTSGNGADDLNTQRSESAIIGDSLQIGTTG